MTETLLLAIFSGSRLTECSSFSVTHSKTVALRLESGSMDISQSVQSLLQSKERVIEKFYRRLLEKHPELSPHFENRDLMVQASMLTMALVSVEAFFFHRFPATEHYLKVLGYRHAQTGVQIGDYPKFSQVLLEILAEFHANNWNAELAEQWQQALDVAIETMKHGYDETYTI